METSREFLMCVFIYYLIYKSFLSANFAVLVKVCTESITVLWLRERHIPLSRSDILGYVNVRNTHFEWRGYV